MAGAPKGVEELPALLNPLAMAIYSQSDTIHMKWREDTLSMDCRTLLANITPVRSQLKQVSPIKFAVEWQT